MKHPCFLPAIFALFLALFSPAVSASDGNGATPKNTAPTTSTAGTPALFTPQKTELSGVPVALPGRQLFLVETKVDGVPAKMLLDTGASHTSLDFSWARENFPDATLRPLEIDNDGNVYKAPTDRVFLLPVKKFSVGGNAFHSFFMPLADLRGLRAALPELSDVVGILGMNTVALAPCRISFKNRTLQWLSRDALDKLEGKEKLHTQAVRGTDCMLVVIFSPKDSRPFSALIDCGATGSSVPAEMWVGERPEKHVALATTHAGTRYIEIATGVPAPLKFSETFSLENVAPELLPAGSVPKILLGLDVLTRFDLVFDHANNAAFAVKPDAAAAPSSSRGNE